MVTHMCLTFLRVLNYHNHTHATAVSFRNSDVGFSEDTPISKQLNYIHSNSAANRFTLCARPRGCVSVFINWILLFSACHSAHSPPFILYHPFIFPCVLMRRLRPHMNGWPVSSVSAPTSKVKPCELTECILNITVGIFVYTNDRHIFFLLLSVGFCNSIMRYTRRCRFPCVLDKEANEREEEKKHPIH